MKINVIFLIIVAFYGCHTGNNKENPISLDPLIKIEIDLKKSISELPIKDILDSSSFCFLGKQSDCIIGEIDKLILHNDCYYVLDKKQFSILVFDKAGNNIFHFTKKGPGPREYNNISDFTIFENKICVLDIDKILMYTLSGKYIKKVRLDFTATRLENIENKYFSFYRHSNTIRAKKLSYDLIITNHKGKVLKKYFPYTDKDEKDNATTKQQFYVCNNEVHYIQRFNDTIYTLENGHLAPKYVIDFGKYKIPSNPLEDNKYLKFAYFLKDFSETSNKVIFSFNYSNRVYHVIYDKLTTKSLCYKSYSSDNHFLFKGGNPVVPVNNNFLSIYEPYEIAAWIQDLKHNNTADYIEIVETYPHLNSFFNYIANEQLNPIIIFEKYKNIE